MATTVAFLLLLGFVLGGLTLILYAGYQSTEEARARQAQERTATTAVRASEIAVEVPGFLAPMATDRSPATSLTFDDALLAALESHVKAEQAIVTQFVRYPSIDSLYRAGRQELRIH